MAGKKVKKTFGEIPAKVVFLAKTVEFDDDGIAVVEDADVLEVVAQIPGYEFEEDATDKASEDPEDDGVSEDPEDDGVSEDPEDDGESDDETTDETETAKKPKAPRKPAPRKPKK